MWMEHLPGQHYDVRLTAPDGYRAQRSYSIASSPLDEGEIELTIDRLDDGEVSPYFHEVVEEGDQVERAGRSPPTSCGAASRPVLLVGGGSGVVPLMCMLRHSGGRCPSSTCGSSTRCATPDDVIYADELGDDALLTYTREAPEGWTGHTGHIDAELLAAPAEGAARVRLRLERVRGPRLALGTPASMPN